MDRLNWVPLNALFSLGKRQKWQGDKSCVWALESTYQWGCYELAHCLDTESMISSIIAALSSSCVHGAWSGSPSSNFDWLSDPQADINHDYSSDVEEYNYHCLHLRLARSFFFFILREIGVFQCIDCLSVCVEDFFQFYKKFQVDTLLDFILVTNLTEQYNVVTLKQTSGANQLAYRGESNAIYIYCIEIHSLISHKDFSL